MTAMHPHVWRRSRAMWTVGILSLCVLLGPEHLAAQGRVLTSISEQSIRVSAVAKQDGQVWIRWNAEGSEVREAAMDPLVRSLSHLGMSPSRGRIVAIGNIGIERSVTLIESSTGRVVASFYALKPAVSPDNRFLAFEVFRRRTDKDQSARYAVVDLDAELPATATEPFVVFYPADKSKHQRQSEFFWVAPQIVAVLDLAGPEAQVVVAECGRQGSVGRVVTKALDTERLVERTAVNQDVPAASALYSPTITRLPGDGLSLRLKFPAEEALKARRVDLRVW